MYIVLLLLTCLSPAFGLPSKVGSLFPHDFQENREISIHHLSTIRAIIFTHISTTILH